jgi:glucosamine-phosphate N-acetyltransferase
MEFHSLSDYVKRNPSRVSEIKTNYLKLLRELTDAPDISDETFLSVIENIGKMGFTIIGVEEEIIVCTGTIIVEPKIIHGGKCAGHIEDIVVLPSWRGKGLGVALIDHLKMYAINNNCYKVILDCNENLDNFYAQCGFVKSGIQMKI